MPLVKTQAEGINLADTSAFTGTVSGAGANTPSFCATRDTNDQSITASTWTILQFNSEIYDEGGCYNNTGSTVTLNGLSAPAYSFCPNKAGKYLVFGGATIYYSNSNLRWGNIKFGGTYTAGGSARAGLDFSSNYGYSINPACSDIFQLNGTGDYLTISARGYAGGSEPQMESGNSFCYFGAVFLTSN